MSNLQIPAKAGIQVAPEKNHWIPAFAGMTIYYLFIPAGIAQAEIRC